jgi:hypothetical protein
MKATKTAATTWVLALASLLASPGLAPADVIYETNDPFGGGFGLIGFDVFAFQSVGVRFTPDKDYTLDRVRVWFMSNDFEGDNPATVRISLRRDDNDGEVSIPGETLETMEFVVSAVGWEPVLETVESEAHTPLEAGQNYWIVAQSDVEGENGVWNWATNETGFTSNTSGNQDVWQPGGEGAVAATIVEGTPAGDCYPDFTGDGELNLFDFLEYVNAFNAAEDRADCTLDGVLDFFDFLCFTNTFNAGC